VFKQRYPTSRQSKAPHRAEGDTITDIYLAPALSTVTRRCAVVAMENEPVPTAGYLNTNGIYSPGRDASHAATTVL